MGLKLKVECSNWSTTVEVDEELFPIRSGACIEAMTVAVEDFLNGNHDAFELKEEHDELVLDTVVSCEGNCCMTRHILINAGRHSLADYMKNNS